MGDVRKRNMHRCALVRVQAYTRTEAMANAPVQELRTRVNMLEKTWQSLSEEHESLVCQAETADAELVHNSYLTAAEEIFFETMTALNTRITELEVRPEQVIDATRHNVVVQAQKEIKIGTFGGDFAKWNQFRDLYLSAVHNNPAISDVQKFVRLKDAIVGNAARVLGGWQITEANYALAWERLNEVYDDRYLIIKAHLSALHAMPHLQSQSYSGIREIINTTTEHIRALGALHVPVAQWDLILAYIITIRLDQTTAAEWEMSREANELPTLADLLAFLEKRCRGLINSTSHQDDGKAKGKSEPVRSGQHNAKPSIAKGQSTTYTPAPCIICNLSHPLYRCDEFLALDVHKRIERAKILKLCLNCLSVKHNTQACQSGACLRCEGGKKHNSVLCVSRYEKKPVVGLNVQGGGGESASTAAGSSQASVAVQRADQQR